MTVVITPQKIRRGVKRSRREKNLENERRKFAATERALQALELRKAGITYAKIAESIGYSDASSAKRAIDRHLTRQTMDAAEEVILIDLARIDEYVSRCTHALRQTGDLSQIDRLLRLMDAKYRLLGIGDETVRELREKFGVNTALPNAASHVTTNNVMVIQTSQTSENDFVKKMMQAAGVDPDSEHARKYLEEHAPKAIESKSKKKKRIVRSKKKIETPEEAVLIPVYKQLDEEEVVDAEIVEG